MRNKALNIIRRAEIGENPGIKYAAGFDPNAKHFKCKWDALHTMKDVFTAVDQSESMRGSPTWYRARGLLYDAMIDLLAEFHGPTVSLIWEKRKRLNDLVNNLPPFQKITLEDLRG